MKIAIIGAGGVGGYFGARLVKAGFEVSFLARGMQLEAMLNHGLSIKSILGDFEVKNLKARDDISELGVSDLVILAVKAWQLKDIREQLSKIIHSKSLILPLQNGVLAADELQTSVDQDMVLGGICRIISKIESPGVISHFGATPSIVLGALGPTDPDKLKEIKAVFDQAEIESRISSNIRADIWKKFAFICVGGLMAVARLPIGEIRESNETRTLLVELISEILVLAEKTGIEIESEFLEKTLSLIDSFPPQVTFSMARDIWEGRPSELDYLNGGVVRLGKEHHVSTPVNRFIYNVLKPMEVRARSK